MIDPNTGIVIGTIVATTVASAVKGAKAPAQFIDDIMQLAGFGKFNELANRSRYRQEESEAAYKLQIAEGVNAIPEEYQQVPELSIIGPAIDASKYYIEEDTLRTMFANIISASIDSRQNGQVHQSFVEIVKQLSIDDAKHLKQISSQSINPIIHLKTRVDDGKGLNGTYNVMNNVYMSNHLDLEKYNLIGASIINLKRLGLIDIPALVSYASEKNYDSLKNNKFILNVIEDIEETGKHEVTSGLIELTSFGVSFCEICL